MLRHSLLILSLAAALAGGAQAQNRTDNCVEDTVRCGGEANQTLVLKNYCSRTVEFAICVDRSDNNWDEFRRGDIASGASRYLYINDLPPGGSYDYEYVWCYGDICSEQRVPDC